MSTQHTPGPWTYEPEETGFAGAIVAKTGWICDFDTDPSPANARLIAAAPELLEALQNLATVMQELHDHWDNDRDMKVGKGLLALSGLLPGYDKRIDVIRAAIAKASGSATQTGETE